MKSKLMCAAIALAFALPMAANAAPEFTRVGPANFPISEVVVVKGVGGVDMAYASGTPGRAAAGDTAAQTTDALTRLLAGLKAQGFGPGDVVMVRVYLAGDPAKGGKMDFMGMNGAFAKVFGTAEQPNKPARTTVQVAALASPGSLVEIEAQAIKPHT